MVLALDHDDHYCRSRVNIQKEKAVKKKIAFFDFDGTITTKDTLLEFIKYAKGAPSFYFGFLLHSPLLIAYKLNIISNQKAKERILAYFFRNTPLDAFNKICREFASQIIPDLIRPKALEEIQSLQQAGTRIVIVSASPENWVGQWAQSINADLLATRLETTDQAITGKIAGKNCHGEEKVRRIRETYNLSDFDEISAYGDSSGDRPLLSLANHPHYKPFRS
jgi:phosphatidylglycerophosphatase C